MKELKYSAKPAKKN